MPSTCQAPGFEFWLLQQMEKKTFLLPSREENGSNQHLPLTAPLSILLQPLYPHSTHTHSSGDPRKNQCLQCS